VALLLKSHNSAEFDGAPINGLVSLEAAACLIASGARLSVAGREEALKALPAGQWIGGTTPYFMTPDGGKVASADQVFVTELAHIGEVSVASYGADMLDSISGDTPDGGFALTIMPFESTCHHRFALEAAGYPDAFLKPTIGWIAGIDLADPGASAAVFDGRTAELHRDRAVVAHIALPADKMPLVEIVNLFEPDEGDLIRFDEEGFHPAHCIIGGRRVSFADYIAQRGLGDGEVPLVGDFGGARLNASVRRVDRAKGTVELYAPVFRGVDYRFAKPVGDYAGSFRQLTQAKEVDGAIWSCNCILNFLHGQLEGRAIGGLAGPITFGEIAYQLLNQTMVVLKTM
jgi:hypothetical protein